MSTHLEKLRDAGIVGVPHTISPEDEAAINSLSESEVETLIAVKAKLSSPRLAASSTEDIPPVGTMSF